MIKILLYGCNGYMGRVVTEMVKNNTSTIITAGIDTNTEQQGDYPVYADPDKISEQVDVIIDFSNPSALNNLLKFGTEKNIPIILCATGYSSDQINEISKASEQIPIFRSGNMSLGINLLADLIKRTCTVLGEDFDVEIVEKHHRRKVDAPSGTALMLADAAAESLPYKPEYVFERKSNSKPRDKKEIGISSVRGGTIIGVHDVIFAGQDEVIELRHTAASRDVFASGALKAAKFIINKRPGMYNMKDVLKDSIDI